MRIQSAVAVLGLVALCTCLLLKGRREPHHEKGPAGLHVGDSRVPWNVPPATASERGTSAEQAAGWLEDANRALDALRCETRSDDEALIKWLVEFSVDFAQRPGALQEALTVLRTGKASERFRAVLEILVAVLSDSEGQEDLRHIALSREGLAAGAATRAIFLRIRHIRAVPPLAPWFETLWWSAWGDDYIGDLLDPGGGSRQPHEPGYASDGGLSHVDNWVEPNMQDWKGHEADLETLEAIAEQGESPAAKMPALRELPEGPRTDGVIRTILGDDKGCPLLRAFCYEQLDEDNNSNWPLLKHALETETDPDALARAVHAALAPDSGGELIPALEALGQRIPLEQSGALGAVTEDLSIMQTPEALDALVRMVRFQKSDKVRFSAASAIAFCAYGSKFTQPRIDALLGLLNDVDPVVAAMGASGLLDARNSNALRDVAAPVMDDSVMARIRSLSTDPHVPQRVRDVLAPRLRDSDSPPHK